MFAAAEVEVKGLNLPIGFTGGPSALIPPPGSGRVEKLAMSMSHVQ